MAVLSSSLSLSSTSTSTSSLLLSRLVPLKRVLCLCAVPTKNNNKNNNNKRHSTSSNVPYFAVGMAVSDPYLSHAIPVLLQQQQRWNDHQHQNYQNYYTLGGGADRSPPPNNTRSLPSTLDSLLKEIDHLDVAALILTRALVDTTTAAAIPVTDQEKLETTTTTTLENKNASQAGFDLLCWHVKNHYKSDTTTPSSRTKTSTGTTTVDILIDEDESATTSFKEAHNMAQMNPEMWEDIFNLEQQQDHHNKYHPSLHAAISLNTLLWNDNKGWPNTFG